MKLLLTSAGFANKTIVEGLRSLVDKSFKELNLSFIPTASNVEDGDKGWLLDDYANIKALGFACIDIVDISALPRDIWEPRLKKADILMFSGGNTFYLMHWVDKSGLKDLLPELLKTKIWVGVSAGSCITGPTIYNSVQNLFEEKLEFNQKVGLGLVNFQFIPHLNSDYFSKIRKEYLEVAAQKITDPIYAVDDQSAVVVNGDKIQVVSEGKYLTLNL